MNKRFVLFLCASCALLIPSLSSAAELPFSNGLLYHLDASTGLSLNGSSVTGWADQTTNGLNFLQSDPLKQPQRIAGGFNGRDAIRFDGSLAGNAGGNAPNADELILSTGTSVQTFVAVNRLAGANVGLAGIWGITDADSGIRRASGTAWQGSVTSPGNSNDFSFGGTMLINGQTTGTVAEGVPHILLASATSAATFSSTSIGDYFKVGANTPRPYAGDVAEVLVFNRALSVPEQKQLSVHLAVKYDIAGSGLLLSIGGKNQIGTEVFSGANARYVRIHTDGTNSGGGDANANSMHVGEIEVFSGLSGSVSGVDTVRNLALGSRGGSFATVIGTGGHGADSNIVNGVVDGGADTWTRVNPAPPSQVVEGLLDLGAERLVGSVRVWQRGDGCCGERLRNFSVTIEDAAHLTIETFNFPGQVASASYTEFNLADITSAFTVGSADILSIDLNAGTGLGDRLTLGATGLGALTLNSGASLNVANLSGTFSPGQSFDILDFGSVSGAFETINLPGGSAQWDTSNLYTTGVITVVPEPSSVALLLGGLAFSLRRRRF